MSIFELTAILNHHKVAYQLRNKRVLVGALSQPNPAESDLMDISDWNRLSLFRWLQTQPNSNAVAVAYH